MNGWTAGSGARACCGGLGKGPGLQKDSGGPDWDDPDGKNRAVGSRTLDGALGAACLQATGPLVRGERLAKKNIAEHRSMIPLFGCCPGPDADPHQAMRRHQERRLRMLRFWRDAAERQLAALDASISTLEQQMQRAAQEPQA